VSCRCRTLTRTRVRRTRTRLIQEVSMLHSFKVFILSIYLCLWFYNLFKFFFYFLLFITIIILNWFSSTQCLHSSKRKKRGQRAVGGDKNGRGLRQFSMKGFWSVSFYHFVFECIIHWIFNSYLRCPCKAAFRRCLNWKSLFELMT
jgi:hypothetical protein